MQKPFYNKCIVYDQMSLSTSIIVIWFQWFYRCFMPFSYFRDSLWIMHERSMSEFSHILFISSPKLSHYRIKIQDPKLFWMCTEPWYPCNKGVTLQTATSKKISFGNIHVKIYFRSWQCFTASIQPSIRVCIFVNQISAQIWRLAYNAWTRSFRVGLN